MSRSTSAHLRGGVMAMSILYLVCGGIYLISAIGGLELGRELVDNWMENKRKMYSFQSTEAKESLNRGVKLMMSSLYPILYGMLQVCLSSWILIGALLRSRKTCLVWFGVNVIGLVIQQYLLVTSVYAEKVTAYDVLEILLGLFGRCVLMHLVVLFVTKLKDEREMQMSNKNTNDPIYECVV